VAVVCVILPNFDSFRGALRKNGSQSHNYGQFTISISSSKHLQRDRATPRLNILQLQGGNSVAYSYIQDLMRSTCLAIV